MPLIPSKFRSRKIDVVCPMCGYAQVEPAAVVSTSCRKCRVHFDVVGGEAVKPKLLGELGIKVYPPRPVPVAVDKAAADAATPAAPGGIAAPDVVPTVRKIDERKRRDVTCFDCDTVHRASVTSTSTLCPHCGAYIALKDYDIRAKWSSQIKTRGNVVIHKKGIVNGVSVLCHHLTVHGDITGGVDCSGDFTVTRHGKILGRVRCRRLVIAKKAEVEFVNQVFCDEVEIDGEATGSLICKGRVSLATKAKLIGDLVASSLSIAEGARHQGAIKTYQAASTNAGRED